MPDGEDRAGEGCGRREVRTTMVSFVDALVDQGVTFDFEREILPGAQHLSRDMDGFPLLDGLPAATVPARRRAMLCPPLWMR